MKLVIFIVGVIVGVIAGGYFGINITADFAINKSMESMQSILTQQMTGDANQNVNAIIEAQKEKIKTAIEEKKTEFEENMKQELKNYITQKIDGMFSKN